MRTGIKFDVSPPDRLRLERVVRDRNAPQKHAWRASIILLSAEGAGTAAIMRQTGKSKTCVWRWQERYMAAGVDGLLRDKTRPSRIAPLKSAVIEYPSAEGRLALRGEDLDRYRKSGSMIVSTC